MALLLAAFLLATAASGAAAQGVGSDLTASTFDAMLPNRNDGYCPARGFYTHRAFVTAADAFPGFGTTGGAVLRKRELAAFFGQTSQETTGGSIGAADEFQWGYCYKEEVHATAGVGRYYGRGPFNLAYDFNYRAAGQALGVDLVTNPDLVSTDPVIAFKTAIWFWMTAQPHIPSCHDVIVGNWKPKDADNSTGGVPGYGVITQIISGFTCGAVPNSFIDESVGFYKRYCDILGIGTGDILDCSTPYLGLYNDIPPPARASQLKTIVLSSVLGSVAAIAITATVAYFYFTSKYRRWKKEQEKLAKAMQQMPGVPTQVDYADIKKATKNFHESTKLGKGGFGSVYKCTLPAAASRTGHAMEVAVKKFMREVEDRRYNDFLAEVSIINRLRHKNIVPLIGWSYNRGEPVLVYEYMTNGSLDQHIFSRDCRGNRDEEAATKNWDTRYGIVRDIAIGLHYVHHEHEPMVLHRDIKASNIMLDSTFGARLGDFGIACAVATNKSSVTGFAGTFGYIAPDYAMSHKATRQTDIYAFGVLILEIVTGKKNGDVQPEDDHITEWVWRLHREGMLLEAVDNMVVTSGDNEVLTDEAKRLLLIGLACTNPNPSNRPSMVEVVQVINKLAPTPEVPLERPVFIWPPEDWRTRNSLYSTAMSDRERSLTSTTTELVEFSQEAS